MIIRGHALDLMATLDESPDLIITDPPYAFDGRGEEHALTATVAVVLREAAKRLKTGHWMLVFCAASWRSQLYMVEALRGVVTPVRTGTWCKPAVRTKTRTPGWAWASVKVLAFRKGKAAEDVGPSATLDYIVAPPFINGRRAQLPAEVARWAVTPYAVSGGLMFDPFAGSGVLCAAAEAAGMRSLGYELQET
jgi:DNA modification methylase